MALAVDEVSRCAVSPASSRPTSAPTGPIASGAFVQTLALTDIATGWTECAPLVVREQTLPVGVLAHLRTLMLLPLLGLDVD